MAAPHGSAQHYKFDNGKVDVVEEWAENERLLYEKYIASVQARIKKRFERLCIKITENFDEDACTSVLAKTVLKSALILNKERREFMNVLANGFSQNFAQETQKLTFEYAGMKVSKMDCLLHPSRYTRAFAKAYTVFQRKGIDFLYPVFGRLVFLYIYLYAFVFGKK